MSELLTFKDLEFFPHAVCATTDGRGLQAVIQFPNNFGLSVIRYEVQMENLDGEKYWKYQSYTSNDSEWEVEIQYNGDRVSDEMLPELYDSQIIGHLSEQQITDIMKVLQEIKPE